MPDKNSAQCLKAELYINKSGVKDSYIYMSELDSNKAKDTSSCGVVQSLSGLS